MRATKIESYFAWLRRHMDKLKELSGAYGFYNISKILSSKEIEKVKNFCKKSNCINFLTIINGVNPLRPQSTWGGFPEFVRNNTQYHTIYHSENCFIFVSSMTFKSTIPFPMVPFTHDDIEYYYMRSEEEYNIFLKAKENFLECVSNVAKEAEAELIMEEFNND